MQDKRRSKRIFVEMPAEFRGNRVWQIRDISNISAKGIFLVTENVEPPGAVIELIFDIDKKGEKRQFCAQAVVVWNRPRGQKTDSGLLCAGMGVRFIKIFPVDGADFIEDLTR